MTKKSIFDIIDLFDGNSLELIKREREKETRKRIKSDSKQAKLNRLDFIERKNAEHKGICQYCNEKKEFLRYIVDYGLSVCYNCYIEGLQEEAWSYPYSRRVEDMDLYLSEPCWIDEWREENGVEEYEEEKTETEIEREENIKSVITLFDVFKTPLGVDNKEPTLDMIRNGY
jgi:hypothetical protein